MDLSDSIKKAAKQQPTKVAKNAECVNKGVNLGTGRISRYGYDGVGRPTNEGCEVEPFEGQIFDE